MTSFPLNPLAAGAYSLLSVIDFLCLGAGVYLLLLLYDRSHRWGHLLAALGMGVMAMRLVPDHLFMAEPRLQEAALTLTLAIAALLISLGTMTLTTGAGTRVGRPIAVRAVLLFTGGMVAASALLLWALAVWTPTGETGILGLVSSGFEVFQYRLRVAAGAALLACAWITWERRSLGPHLSRMFGLAYVAWAVALLAGVPHVISVPSGFWTGQIVHVLGSMFLANALAQHACREEQVAQRRRRRLQLIDRVISAAIAQPHLQPMVERATEEARALLDADGAAIYLLSSAANLLTCGYRTSECEHTPDAINLAEQAAHPIAVAFLANVPVRYDLALAVPNDGGDATAIPLVGIGQPIGVLVICGPSSSKRAICDTEALANLGSVLGMVIRNMMLLEEVRQARDRWRQTFDASPMILTVHDCEGRITAANAAAQALAGRSEEEMIGLSLCAALKDLPQEQVQMILDCCSGATGPRTSILRQHGRVHRVTVVPLQDDLGRVSGCVRVAHDITSRWRAEERLAQSERRYRALAENANDIIYTHDLDGKFLYVNQAGVRILGYSRQEFSQLRFWDIVAPESQTAAHTYVRNLLEGRPQEEQIALRINCADGRVAVLELRANVLRSAGHGEAIQGIARDVTAEEQLAAQLIQADRLASAGLLIAGIAHELNNPLTTISGYAHLLEDSLGASAYGSMVAKIAEEAERCQRVTRSLLSFARQTDEGRMAFDVNQLVRGVVDLRAYDLREAGIDLVYELGEDLPDIVADYGQIQQVVYNVLDNAYHAVKDREDGEIRVRTWAEDGSVRIEIADNGPGVPPELRDRIFEPFVTTKRRGEGTGLGLSICRRIVEDHDGTIILASNGTPGARFAITLPASEQRRSSRPVQPDGAHQPSPAGQGVRILFVEDEEALRAVVSEYLTLLGYEVDTAASGEEGFKAALSEEHDLIVCDMRLPGMTGAELCEKLLAHDRSFASRLLVATGDILSPQTQEFFERTRLPHIHKPFRLQELAELIARMASTCGASEPSAS